MIQNRVFSVSFHRKMQLRSPFCITHCTSQDDTVHAPLPAGGKRGGKERYMIRRIYVTLHHHRISDKESNILIYINNENNDEMPGHAHAGHGKQSAG